MTNKRFTFRVRERLSTTARLVVRWTLRAAFLIATTLAVVWYFWPQRLKTPTFLKPPVITMTVAVGQVNKEYPRLGGILAEVVNRDTPEGGLRLVIQPTAGSHNNIQAVVSGGADLGFVQGQVFYPGDRKDPSIEALHEHVRVVGQLFTSTMTLLASDGSGIGKLEDLRGRRVGIHSLSSTDGRTLLDLLEAVELTWWVPPHDRKPEDGSSASAGEQGPADTDVVITTGSVDHLVGLMKRGELDAVFASISHPSDWARRFLISSDAHFVPLVVDLDRLRRHSPTYLETSLPASFYPLFEVGVDVTSVGSRTLLVASATMPDAQAYELAKALVEGVETLKKSPYFHDLSGTSLVEGIPLEDIHPGARRLYQEKRLTSSSSPRREVKTPGPLTLLSAASGETTSALLDMLNARMAEAGSGKGVQPALEVAASSPPPDPEILLNSVSSGECDLGMLPTGGSGPDTSESETSGMRLPTRNVRSVCRLPGEVAQLAVAVESGAYALRDLSEMRLGYTANGPAALRDWIDAHLGAEDLPPPVWLPFEPGDIEPAYADRQIAGFLDLAALPSARVKAGHRVRPLRLVPLYPAPNGAPPARELEPVLISAADYPVPLASDIPSWMAPLELLSSNTVPKDRIVPLVSAILRGGSRGMVRYGGSPLGREWFSEGRRFPRHDGATVLDTPEAATGGAPTQATPAPVVPVPTGDAAAAAEETEPLLFTAGSPTGTSYEIAAGLAEFLGTRCRQSLKDGDICPPGTTAALVAARSAAESIDLTAAGKSGFAIVPADLAYQALTGDGAWKGHPVTHMRAVASLYVTALTVLSSSRETLVGAHVSGGGALKSGERRPKPGEVASIKDLLDLEGRRVSMRHAPGNAPRGNAITLFNRGTFYSKLWRYSLLTDEPPPTEAARLFMDGSIVALFLMAPHPSNFVNAMLERNADVTVLPVTGLDAHLEDTPFLARTAVDLSVYGDDQESRRLVPTIGIPMVLVTTADRPAEEVQRVLATLIGEAASLRREYPVLGHLTLELMQSTAGLKLHDAAAAFFEAASQRSQVRR